jgi:Fe-S cluster assembly iron-binding protein IscA
MAAPNIVGITTLVGFSTFTTLANTNATSIVSNAAASNKVLKVTSVIVANTGDSNVEYVHVSLNDMAAGGGGNRYIQKNVGIETGTSQVVIDRASAVYLEENQSLVVQSNTRANVFDVIASYEEIED